MPKEFEVILEQKQKDKGWADATCAAALYFAIDDDVLALLQKAIQAKPATRLPFTSMGFELIETECSSKGWTATTCAACWKSPSLRTLGTR